MNPSVVYILPASSLHGGVRVVFEHAEGLAQRGYSVEVVGPEPPPDWHPLRIPYRQVPLHQADAIPAADIVIGTFWTTVGPAFQSGAPHVFHLSQGFEGVHREYASILDQIDETYRLPIPKLLISAHLEPVLTERYGCRCHLLSQAIDSDLFSPGDFRREPQPFRVGLVGPYEVRSKGIRLGLEGLALARERGLNFEVHRASADPQTEEESLLGVVDHYRHRIPTAEMPSFYRGLDALLYTSDDEEGFPLPPLEAMASGVPVALTDIRSFAVLPDDAVIRYPFGTAEAVADVMVRLVDIDQRQRLRHAGLETVAQYTLDRVLDRLEAAFAAEGAPLASPSSTPD